MSRLSSFRGPSTPSSSPVQSKRPPDSPSPPFRSVESTYHRQVRTLLQELRGVCQTWDELVFVDGLKAAQGLTDARTENALALIPLGEQTRTRLVGPKLDVMEKNMAELDSVITKLRKQFRRMDSIVEALESMLYEASKTKSWQWVSQEPLWMTWSLEKFVTSIASILPPYHRELHNHIEIVDKMRSHSLSFEESRALIVSWAEQRWLEEDGWDANWEDLCAIEVDRWTK